jgi:hypothetical protein
MSTALAAVHSSNMSNHHKSAIRRFWDEAKGKGSSLMGRSSAHLRSTGATVRQGGESILVGGLLGYAHVELPNGLDIKVPNSKISIPLDGAVAAIGMLGGIALANEEGGVDLRNAGASAASVFAFRKAYDFAAEKKKASGGHPGGTFGADQAYGMGEERDEIIECARQIGG